MNKHEEFKRAYADYPSQDNEGYVPDRGGFKAGFGAAWDLLQAQLAEMRAELKSTGEQLETWRKLAHERSGLEAKLELITRDRDNVLHERDNNKRLLKKAEAKLDCARDALVGARAFALHAAEFMSNEDAHDEQMARDTFSLCENALDKLKGDHEHTWANCAVACPEESPDTRVIGTCCQCGSDTRNEDIKGDLIPYKLVKIPLPISLVAERCQNPSCRDYFLSGHQVRLIDEAIEPLYKAQSEKARCKHDVDGTDCFTCYPSQSEKDGAK